MEHLPFTKMHGLGNDFIVIDDIGTKYSTSIPMTPSLARRLCDRRFGVGADQLLWLRRAQDVAFDVRMEILNADGSGAEMCGNGIRAVGLYLDRYYGQRKAEYRVETLAGVKTVQVQGTHVTVDMGQPRLGAGFQSQGEALTLEGREFRFFEVDMGNPHAVFFVEDVAQFPVEKMGPQIETLPRFPQRTNVEFVEILDSQTIRVRVWERGAGITLACGTGACAAAVASLVNEKVRRPLDVQLPGGSLRISWEGEGQSVMMEGPAQEVFKGMFLLDF
jgi:diaminopimelate epimerase